MPKSVVVDFFFFFIFSLVPRFLQTWFLGGRRRITQLILYHRTMEPCPDRIVMLLGLWDKRFLSMDTPELLCLQLLVFLQGPPIAVSKVGFIFATTQLHRVRRNRFSSGMEPLVLATRRLKFLSRALRLPFLSGERGWRSVTAF
jgi:hypothetical protein